MLGELSVLVELVGRADALNPPSHIVAVAEARSSQPHPAAEVLVHDLAVLADTQRRRPLPSMSLTEFAGI